jgi:hypothetical protein
MRARTQYYWLMGAVLLASASACSYSPHPEDGKQQCYSPSRQCPDGYVCQDDGYCWSAGHAPVVTPGTGGVIPGTGGAAGGSGGTSAKGGSIGTGGLGAGGVVITGGKAGSGGIIISAGGITGTGGATPCQPGRATGSNPLIDNMSDGDGAILQVDGRSGGWYSFNDGNGTQTPLPPAITAKPGWICSSGSGFSTWGAGIGVTLNSDATKSCTYDASIYKGVAFALQGSVTGGKLRFNVQTADIASTATSGGTCVSTSTTNNCDDYYGAEILGSSFQGAASVTCASSNAKSWTCSTASTAATSTVVSIPFAYTSQEGWGKSFASLNLAQILQLHWEIKDYYENLNYGPVVFDLCIGNVSFF